MRSSDEALAAVSEAVLGIAGDLALDVVLDRLLHAARDLVSAKYAALGIPDEEGTGFAHFLTAGMDDDLIAAMGPLPRTHGMLGAMLVDPAPFRTDDIRTDPRFKGWWPSAHPSMRSFLGVPIVFRGDIIGAFYLTDKVATPSCFDADDERLIGVLAAHAGVLIEHARLYERAREATVAEERTRLARDLHDALSQTLFSLRLVVAAAAANPAAAAGQLADAGALVETAMGELRTMVGELQPPDLAKDGLVTTLRRHLDVVGRAHQVPTTFEVEELGPLDAGVEEQLYRIAQEAVTNAIRHGHPSHVSVRLAAPAGTVVLEVRDDGDGFDPDRRAISGRHLGLTSMRDRAKALGGTLAVGSDPGAGTIVTAKVPLG